jgi:energy-coupling factor transporter ATP-binding protein EcfA2
MFKQSSYVLALFLGTSSAAQLTNSFATGMNGDEDMGEDITMKGDKFHFVQQMGANGCGKGELMTAGGNCLFQSEALQLNADPAAEPKATATTYPEPEKVHTLDPKIAKAHTTFYNGHKHVSDTYPANDE